MLKLENRSEMGLVKVKYMTRKFDGDKLLSDLSVLVVISVPFLAILRCKRRQPQLRAMLSQYLSFIASVGDVVICARSPPTIASYGTSTCGQLDHVATGW